MSKPLALAAAAVLLAADARAQVKTADIDRIFSWVTPGMPGCVAAASQDGKLVVNRAYGLADLERNVPLTTESLLDAGSIRKQFVAAAVLLLVEEGKLSLSDDVRKHIPELPDYGHRLTIAGGRPLAALSKERFANLRPRTEFMSNDAFELLFLSTDQFDLKSMEGTATRYRRAKPYAPTAEDLKTFAGRYESRELRATFDITPGKQGLMVQLNEERPLGREFLPADPDTFAMGMFYLRFRRDSAGSVVALDFTNPALRNVRYTRVTR